jgi:diguanylate cyclase (GGDEF)-like protein/PAS domain S-box-containing protein
MHTGICFALAATILVATPTALVSLGLLALVFTAATGTILIALKRHARSARQLTEEYCLTFDTNPHPLWIYDAETLEFLAVNQAACESHGYTREEFERLRLPDIVEASEVPQILTRIAASASVSSHASCHLRKDGTELPMDITAHSIVFRGRPARFVMGIDVSEKLELEREMLHRAFHDNLTGLANRALFEEQLKDVVARAAGAEEKLAILCLNVDRFKSLNHTYGTAAGDECLRKVAEILRAQAGPAGLVARMGGDRFALVLTGMKSGLCARRAIADLMNAFREPVAVGESRIALSVRAGLAMCPDDGVTVEALWRSAESALDRAREAGGGQVVWSSSELRRATEQKLELEAFMREQLQNRGFHLVYQPLFAMDGRVQSLEALLRLNHPLHGPVSPARFIPLAEETGLIVPLGEWVIEEACRQISKWRQAGIRPVPVAVNVSVLQLMQKNFASRVLAILSRYTIAPEQIELEVTESSSMLNEAEVMRQMEMLTRIGIRFALDDFGTGHSSLNRLDKLPLEVLKVDRAFVERICEVDGTRSIVQATIRMAKALNMRVVAEGVERVDQLVALSEMGCDFIQGFLLSPPVPAGDVPYLVGDCQPLLTNIAVFRSMGEMRPLLAN